MFTLYDCDRGDKVQVVKLHTAAELKQRLISFGIMKESLIEVLGYAPRKKTMEVRVGKMNLALRDEEAKLIEVQKYEH